MCLYVVGWDILVCSVSRAMEEGVARWRQQSGHAGMLVATGFSVVSWRRLSRKTSKEGRGQCEEFKQGTNL